MKRLLLHVCCAPCAAAAVEKLIDDYDITMFFYNPQIFPLKEYRKRLEDVRKLSEKLGVPMLEGDHDPCLWYEATEGHEKDKEHGERCDICFRFRLKDTLRILKEKEFDLFATTLTISPHKSAEKINEIGRELSKEPYLESDFKKHGGFERSIELSKWFKLYRQNYCGCVYSLNKSIASPKE
jgi:predicted adenine nucleotide alpha hydrolase (AANH) superfamily ATPase